MARLKEYTGKKFGKEKKITYAKQKDSRFEYVEELGRRRRRREKMPCRDHTQRHSIQQYREQYDGLLSLALLCHEQENVMRRWKKKLVSSLDTLSR